MNSLLRTSTSRIARNHTNPYNLQTRLFSYDHVVIGGGVVGLAVAAKLAEYSLLGLLPRTVTEVVDDQNQQI
jgi:heterodisulfide reductase subunit A-like polyferredoxin